MWVEAHVLKSENALANSLEMILPSLRSISDSMGEILSRYPGELDLRGVEVLSDAAAEWLSQQPGRLFIGTSFKLFPGTPGFVSLARKLSNSQAHLSFDKLTHLSDSIAREFSHAKVAGIAMPALVDVSVEGAMYLSCTLTDLDVKLERLPKKVRAILLNHPSLCVQGQ